MNLFVEKEEKNSQKRQAEKIVFRAWSKASKVDEEATENEAGEREGDRSSPRRSEAGKPRLSRCPDVLSAFLPGFCLLGTFPADDPNSEQMGTRTLPWGVSLSFPSWCLSLNLKTVSQRKYSPYRCLWSTCFCLKIEHCHCIQNVMHPAPTPK